MFYSVIVPSYNNKNLTKKCLAAIFKNTEGVKYEVIVVDDFSTDGARELLRDQKGITYIESKTNLGFAKTNNVGAKKATGEVLIFLNNDTEVQPGWIEGIEEIFKKNEKVGAVGVKLIFPDRLIQHAGVVISEDKTPRHIYYRSAEHDPKVNKVRQFQAVTAACVAIPKKIYLQVGGFDESFRTGLEDVDLCLRLGQKGYKIYYAPSSVVIHHESVAPGRFTSNQHNADLYMSRWKSAHSDEHEYYRADGYGFFRILLQDLREMSYGKDEYSTRPLRIKILRYLYIPLQKISTVVAMILRGEFGLLKSKIQGRLHA